jgi:hypothetical protein
MFILSIDRFPLTFILFVAEGLSLAAKARVCQQKVAATLLDLAHLQ